MAVKVEQPLFSLRAQGQFANLLIYQHNNYQNLVYHKVRVKDKITSARRIARIDYSECSYAWKTLDPAGRVRWQNLKSDYRLSGNNMFVKWFFTELFNSIYGVGFYGGTRYGCKRPTPKLNPYYMLNVRKKIYGV